MPQSTPPTPESPLRRYRRVVAEVLAARGAFCEGVHPEGPVPSRHVHHILPCSETGIASELVYDPANLIVLCDACHALMHPLIRAPSWQGARVGRGRRLQG